METNLLFDFKVDKDSKTVFVNREFAADLPLVWEAFTKPEILDKWWAPKPWESRTKSMEFKKGGRRFYAMVSPEGEEHWCIQDFISISPTTNFKFHDAFADKDENINRDFPRSEWDLNFSMTNSLGSGENGITTVTITIKHQTPEDLEQIIKMGFKEGFTMTLNYLEQLLSQLNNQKNLTGK